MARQTLIALVMASLLVAGLSADTSRTLQQAVTYDCNGAKQINSVKNACNLLCTCAGSLNKAYATANMKSFCLTTCGKCAAAGATCKPGSGLPSACSAGTSIKEVNSCITTFLKSRGGH